jgi:hypothetical protein
MLCRLHDRGVTTPPSPRERGPKLRVHGDPRPAARRRPAPGPPDCAGRHGHRARTAVRPPDRPGRADLRHARRPARPVGREAPVVQVGGRLRPQRDTACPDLLRPHAAGGRLVRGLRCAPGRALCRPSRCAGRPAAALLRRHAHPARRWQPPGHALRRGLQAAPADRRATRGADAPGRCGCRSADDARAGAGAGRCGRRRTAVPRAGGDGAARRLPHRRRGPLHLHQRDLAVHLRPAGGRQSGRRLDCDAGARGQRLGAGPLAAQRHAATALRNALPAPRRHRPATGLCRPGRC